MDVKSYLSNPCGTYAIPFWKQKIVVIPENMKVIHHRDFDLSYLDEYGVNSILGYFMT